jgi:hypothetical protein
MSQSRLEEYGHCWCGNPIEGRTSTLRFNLPASVPELDAVPQGVCHRCAFTFYKTDVLETIEAAVRGRLRDRRCNSGPV